MFPTLLFHLAPMLEQMRDSGDLPLRIAHNDTKLNNVLFDQKKNPLGVIDLDTMGPGLVHYDFGDAIRTIANEGEEDSEDLNSVLFSIPTFSAFTIGYLGETKGLLTRKEKATLHMAPKVMTFIMAVRFLSDFLNKDIYFNTTHKQHNLLRARAQLKFVNELDNNRIFIKDLIGQNAV